MFHVLYYGKPVVKVPGELPAANYEGPIPVRPRSGQAEGKAEGRRMKAPLLKLPPTLKLRRDKPARQANGKRKACSQLTPRQL